MPGGDLGAQQDDGDGAKKPHILVIIDRANLESPLELIVAHSESPVMNSESIQSIVDSYIKEQ